MLNKKQKYLQIALNNNLSETRSIINQIPLDNRIIIEAGTPLIKAYGADGIRKIRLFWEQRIFGYSSNISEISPTNPWIVALTRSLEKNKTFFNKKRKTSENKKFSFNPYIVADLKCMDRGAREVEIAREGGADAATALGHAPIETLDAFIQNCWENNLDSMVDMMNVDFPLNVLRQLKKLPEVVILHRGVDEEAFNREKEIPYHEIQRIKSNYDIMIAVAGGDTFREAQRAIFNDVDIVVVWKSFFKSTGETAELAKRFLEEIR